MDFFSTSASTESPLIHSNGTSLSSLIGHFNHIFKVSLGQMAEEGERKEAEKSEIIQSIRCFLVSLPGVPAPGAAVAVAGSGTLCLWSSSPPGSCLLCAQKGCYAQAWTLILESSEAPHGVCKVPEAPNPPSLLCQQGWVPG